MHATDDPVGSALPRRLGLGGATVVGLAAMLGAGVFVAFAPAAAVAGELLLLSLLVAALLAAANAHSSARLAVRYPTSGGTYVYARERLGLPWGHLAGWAFMVGKTASCAVMALTVGAHLWPENETILGLLVVLGALVLNLQGITRSAQAAAVIVGLVLLVLGCFVVAMFLAPPDVVAEAEPETARSSVWGVLQGAGFLFFAFAGFARVATLGEEVRSPGRTIPRAIGLSLAVVLAVYATVALAFTTSVGVGWLAARVAPLAEAAEISGWSWLGSVLRFTAGVAAAGALLALTLGVTRTVVAMARDHHLPRQLARVEGTHAVPRAAVLAVCIAVAVLVLLADVRASIGVSSFCVLVYYALANASAWTLAPGATRVVPAVGLLGCLAVAVVLPWESVLFGVLVLGIGAFVGWFRHTTRDASPAELGDPATDDGELSSTPASTPPPLAPEDADEVDPDLLDASGTTPLRETGAGGFRGDDVSGVRGDDAGGAPGDDAGGARGDDAGGTGDDGTGPEALDR